MDDPEYSPGMCVIVAFPRSEKDLVSFLEVTKTAKYLGDSVEVRERPAQESLTAFADLLRASWTKEFVAGDGFAVRFSVDREAAIETIVQWTAQAMAQSATSPSGGSFTTAIAVMAAMIDVAAAGLDATADIVTDGGRCPGNVLYKDFHSLMGGMLHKVSLQ